MVSSIACLDGDDHDFFAGVFVCRSGNALIDFRMFLQPRPRRKQKPVALFFQVKHTRIDAASQTYPLPSILQWYQKTVASLSAYSETFEVVLGW